jgi:hypothetical protein
MVRILLILFSAAQAAAASIAPHNYTHFDLKAYSGRFEFASSLLILPSVSLSPRLSPQLVSDVWHIDSIHK